MNETILITGANRGLGLALAGEFARHGWQVLACCRNPRSAPALEKLAASHPDQVEVLPLEVTDPDQVAALAEGLAGRAIDILFNNAGIFGPKPQGFGPIDEQGWLETFRVNTIAPLQLSVALVDQVARSRRKIIAIMGSLLGSIGENQSSGSYAYRSSKAAVHMVAKNLSVDLRDRGISAVAMHPGWVHTELGGAEAPLSPELSAAGMFKVLTSLSLADSGKLWTYDGKVLPW
ncbi:short-chain dehydrogenase [Desulfuromonas versatilis]|uniref:Short-chain dehydrogenase n=1 Tax=Desulfuromonas versatilis TaxID=2802975 RepID=A0ABM8HSA0_9BACT|nr:SDR family oxidoreductase [Desulfuromonas versatilis]BCR03335.1 short-chain dehydrogenase [Desulfuromonas versatilis]